MSNRSKFSLNVKDYDDIDSRLYQFLKDWKVIQQYKNQTVTMPGTWNSEIFPVKYFEVIKKPGDPNYDPNETENEIGLTLWAGWKEYDNSGAYDHEVEINLFILGKDVNDQKNFKISAEILKAGGAEMKVFFKNSLVTDFTKNQLKKVWWTIETTKSEVDKIWIADMTSYLKF